MPTVVARARAGRAAYTLRFAGYGFERQFCGRESARKARAVARRGNSREDKHAGEAQGEDLEEHGGYGGRWYGKLVVWRAAFFVARIGHTHRARHHPTAGLPSCHAERTSAARLCLSPSCGRSLPAERVCLSKQMA